MCNISTRPIYTKLHKMCHKFTTTLIKWRIMYHALISIFKSNLTWKNWTSWWPTKVVPSSYTISRRTSFVPRVSAKRPLDSGLLVPLLTSLCARRSIKETLQYIACRVWTSIGLCGQIWIEFKASWSLEEETQLIFSLPYVLWTYWRQHCQQY